MNKILFAAGLLALLGGCSTVNTVERADPVNAPKMVKDKRVITDSSLEGYAYIAGVNEAMEGDLLKIQVALVNSSGSYRTLNYKFTWFDKNGMELTSAVSPWQTLTLEGGEKRFVSAVAPDPRCKDFTLKLLPNVR